MSSFIIFIVSQLYRKSFSEQHFLNQGENMEHPHSFGTAMGEPHLHEEEADGQGRAKGGGAGCRDHRTLGSERW